MRCTGGVEDDVVRVAEFAEDGRNDVGEERRRWDDGVAVDVHGGGVVILVGVVDVAGGRRRRSLAVAVVGHVAQVTRRRRVHHNAVHRHRFTYLIEIDITC